MNEEKAQSDKVYENTIDELKQKLHNWKTEFKNKFPFHKPNKSKSQQSPVQPPSFDPKYYLNWKIEIFDSTLNTFRLIITAFEEFYSLLTQKLSLLNKIVLISNELRHINRKVSETQSISREHL